MVYIPGMHGIYPGMYPGISRYACDWLQTFWKLGHLTWTEAWPEMTWGKIFYKRYRKETVSSRHVLQGRKPPLHGTYMLLWCPARAGKKCWPTDAVRARRRLLGSWRKHLTWEAMGSYLSTVGFGRGRWNCFHEPCPALVGQRRLSTIRLALRLYAFAYRRTEHHTPICVRGRAWTRPSQDMAVWWRYLPLRRLPRPTEPHRLYSVMGPEGETTISHRIRY